MAGGGGGNSQKVFYFHKYFSAHNPGTVATRVGNAGGGVDCGVRRVGMKNRSIMIPLCLDFFPSVR